MKRIAVALATVVASTTGTVIGWAPGSAAAAISTISGVVTDTSGAPIAGATVIVQRFEYEVFSHLRATSDADGRYAIAGVTDGSWKVGAAAPGFAYRYGNASTFTLGTAVVVADDNPITFDVTLPRTTAAISGTVTGPGGAPVSGVEVHASAIMGLVASQFGAAFNPQAYDRRVVTDASGNYRFEGLAPAAFNVSFLTQYYSDTGLPPQPSPLLSESYPDTHGGPGTPVTPVEGAELTGIDAQLELGATLSGRVLDADGNPVAAAYVYSTQNLEFGGTQTDAGGNYQLIGLAPGVIQLYAYNEALNLPVPYRTPGDAGFTEIAVELGGSYTGYDIQFERYGTVAVTVVRPDGSLAPQSMIACRAPGVPRLGPPPIPDVGSPVECSSGGLLNSLGADGYRLPEDDYNAVGQEGAYRFNATTVVSNVATFTVRADTPLECTFVLAGEASCAPTDPATLDGDGVASVVEDRAPNDGDGNADGIRDATQSNVTSAPDATGTGTVTFVVPEGRRITRAGVSPASILLAATETGTFSLRIEGADIGGTVPLTILRTSGGQATELLAESAGGRRAMPADFDGTTITVELTDGNEFDVDYSIFPPPTAPDGVIGGVFTPVIPDRTPPVITCPSPEPAFAQSPLGVGFVRVTVSDDGSGVVIPPPSPFPFSTDAFTRVVSLDIAGNFTAEFTFSDRAGNTATTSCSYSVVALDVTPPSIQCVGTNVFEVGAAATVSAFASDNVALATPANMSQQADTSSVGLKFARFDATDTSGNSASWFCYYNVVGDTDGVPAVVEDGAPNAGDGNFDGTPDRDQSHVASLPEPDGEGYATIDTRHWVSFQAVPIVSITATSLDGLPSPPAGVSLMSGIYRVTVDSPMVYSMVRFGSPYDRLYTTVDGAWVPTFPSVFDGSSIDLDGAGNGTVTFEFAPAVVERTPPVIECPAAPEFAQLQTNATLTALVSDADSGVDSTTVTTVVDTSVPGVGTVTVFANDRVGNVASVSCEYFVRPDLVPPTITCPSAQTYLLNDPNATLIATVTDADTGPTSTTTSGIVGTIIVGSETATLTATDRAGNIATATCEYFVGVRIEQLTSPSPDGVASATPYQLVGLRWRAVDYYGNGVDDAAHFIAVTSTAVTCDRGDSSATRVRFSGLRSLGDGNWEYGWRAPRREGCHDVTIDVIGDHVTARIRVG